MMIKNIKRVFTVVILSCITTFVYAADDSAPVYDADSLPAQFDGQPDLGSSGSAAIPSAAPQQRPLAADPGPATGGSFDQRLGRLEQQMNNQGSGSNTKVDQLQTEVQSLRGQVEDLSHQLQQLQTQVKTMYTDVDKRLSKKAAEKPAEKPAKPAADDAPTADVPKTEDLDAEAQAKATDSAIKAETKPAKPSKKAVSDDGQPNVAEEQQTYQTAYDLIKAKKYNDAIAALQKMLQKYPTGQFAANAHYWLGELYGLTSKNDQSANEFSAVIKNFPDSPKVADAQFKLGLIYATQQKWSEAKAAFKKVINNYPGSASAQSAADQLKQLKKAGH